MITGADIKKMKAVFATKEDLKDFATKEGLKDLSKGIDGLSDRVESLSKGLQNTTEELVELITNGFNLNEERFGRIEAEVFKSN